MRVVAGLILNSNGQGLVTKRSKKMSSPGLWEIPGGKVEPGEPFQSALIRELKEELDVWVEVKNQFASVSASIGDRKFTMDAFVCAVQTGVIRLVEHEQLRWIDAENIKDLSWAPLDIPLLSDLSYVLRNAAQGRV